MTTILSDSVPFHNEFSVPSGEVYCKRKVIEVILIDTSGRMKGGYLFKVERLGKPSPGGSKVRINFRQNSMIEIFSKSKLIIALID